MGDHPGTVGRRFRIHFINGAADVLGLEHALLDQQLAQRPLQQLEFAGRPTSIFDGGVRIAMIVIVRLGHCIVLIRRPHRPARANARKDQP